MAASATVGLATGVWVASCISVVSTPAAILWVKSEDDAANNALGLRLKPAAIATKMRNAFIFVFMVSPFLFTIIIIMGAKLRVVKLLMFRDVFISNSSGEVSTIGFSKVQTFAVQEFILGRNNTSSPTLLTRRSTVRYGLTFELKFSIVGQSKPTAD